MTAEHKHPPYMAIWIWLFVLTIAELGAAQLFHLEGMWGPTFILLMGLAVVKALLVAMYFMHLRFERRTFTIIVTSPIILAIILVIALFPDVALKLTMR